MGAMRAGIAFCFFFFATGASAQTCPSLATVETSTLLDGRILVPVIVEGRGLSLMLDTGGISTTIKWERVADLGLTATRTMRKLKGAAGTSLNSFISGEDFRIGNLRVENKPMYLETRPLFGADGTLSPDILRHYDVEIDPGQDRLSLMRPGTCAPDSGAEAIAITVTKGGHVRFPVKIDGKTIMATLDTGTMTSLVSIKTAVRLGIYPNSSRLRLARRSGSYRIYDYPFETLEIGGIKMNKPNINIASENFIPGPADDLILGINALRQMRLTIAYGRGRLYLRPPLRS
jgi:predicted aspartyl protease